MLALFRNSLFAAPQRLTIATALMLIATLFISFAIANGILFDLAFSRFDAWLVLAATLVELGAAIFYLGRKRGEIIQDRDELFGFLALVLLVTAYMLYPSLPALLPPSRHFDAAHHAIHAQFIYENSALPRELNNGGAPYLMTGYPAGGALFAALTARWLGADPIQTLHPIISVILGLSAGLVFLFAGNLLPPTWSREPIAFLATLLLFTAWSYFPGSVNERYFYAQAFAQFFALAVFFFAYQYFTTRDSFWLALIPLGISLILVTHPTPVVAPTLAAFLAIGIQPQSNLRQKFLNAFVITIGLVPVTLLYVLPHLPAWIGITGYGEATPFDLNAIGVVLPVLGIIGALLALRRDARPSFGFVALLALCVLAQPIALYVGRFFLPAISPYYFDKALYLLIYPLAILAALPLYQFTSYLLHFAFSLEFRSLLSLRASSWLALFAFAFLLFAFSPPRPFAPLTASELAGARWAKQNLDPKNLAVVSGIRDDAYWVYLVVLGLPPSVPATADAYHLGAMTYKEWRENPGEPDFALVRNLAREPKDATTQTVWQAGESAILKKPASLVASAASPKLKTDYKVDDLMKLVGYDTADFWNPGSTAAIKFYWQTIQWPPFRTAIFVQIIDPNGDVVAREEKEILQDQYPTQHYPRGVILPDEWQFAIPATARLGKYRVEFGFFSKLIGVRYPISDSPNRSTEQLQLDGFTVALSPPTPEEVRGAGALDARFGYVIALRAFTLAPNPAKRGDSVAVTLYWESIERSNEDYTVFVHLVDANGEIIAQDDSPPQMGARSTSAWNAGDLVKDIHRILIPNDAPPGNAIIRVGLYTPRDLRRVPVQIGPGVANDFVTVPGGITVR